MTRSAVGAFWPGCFRALLEEDVLPEAFFAALVEFLPEGFAELFFVEAVEELVLRLFTEVPAAAFLLGAAFLVCEP